MLNLVLKKRRSPDAFSPTSTPPDFSEKVGKRETSQSIYRELADATPPSITLGMFPEWQAILVKSEVLGFDVWVVRNHLDGIAIAKETGQPALLLDDVLRLKAATQDEAREALLPALICPFADDARE